jgi:hypothetical protein
MSLKDTVEEYRRQLNDEGYDIPIPVDSDEE